MLSNLSHKMRRDVELCLRRSETLKKRTRRIDDIACAHSIHQLTTTFELCESQFQQPQESFSSWLSLDGLQFRVFKELFLDLAYDCFDFV